MTEEERQAKVEELEDDITIADMWAGIEFEDGDMEWGKIEADRADDLRRELDELREDHGQSHGSGRNV